MKSINDNPADSLGNLGPAIRDKAPAPSSKPTETPGIWRTPDGKLETHIPPPSPVWHPVVSIEDGQAEDWEGLCVKTNVCKCGAQLVELQDVYVCTRLECLVSQPKERA